MLITCDFAPYNRHFTRCRWSGLSSPTTTSPESSLPPGDSSTNIADGRRRIGGLLTGGAGKTESDVHVRDAPLRSGWSHPPVATSALDKEPFIYALRASAHSLRSLLIPHYTARSPTTLHILESFTFLCPFYAVWRYPTGRRTGKSSGATRKDVLISQGRTT